MHIVAGGTTQCVKIDALVFEPGVIGQVSPMAAGTGCRLGFPVTDRVCFSMNGVAGGTVDGPPVVSAADKLDLAVSHAFLRMTAQAGMQLFLSWGRVLFPSKPGQGWETATAVCTGNMDASGAMTGFTAISRSRRARDLCVAMGACSHRANLLAGVTR